jgi:hypothetical protein
MKTMLFAVAIALISTAASAQTSGSKPAAAPVGQMVAPTQSSMTCKARAADKKLAGAALSSFMKKCQSDASTTCDVDSKTKKLAGAAKTSHMTKCVNDAVGT